jgi:CRISPR-associated endonuclease/helicase Cas3
MSLPLAHSANGSGATHHLEAHSLSVAALATSFASGFESVPYAECAGLWHDLGKNAPGFQAALARAAEAHIEGAGTGYGDHSSAGAIHALDKFKAAGVPLALVIAGHHGGLGDRAEVVEGRLKEPEKRKRLADCLAASGAFIPEVSRPEPPDFLRPAPRSQGAELKRRYEFWVRMLFSCLVDADFLDTESHFDADRGTRRGGHLAPAELLRLFNLHMAKMVGGGTVNEARQRVLADCRRVGRESGRGVFTLTAPTGCGKTLAGMGFALEHAVERSMDRVIVVIPYTSIIDQNAKVFRDVFGAANVIDHHASLDPIRETPENRVACENWDAPVIVTTSVQFVESLFSNRTSRCRKLHNVANSVVIFDEVQTLPVGHLSPILDALKELVANYKVSLVLSTATQPALRHRPTLACGFQGVKEIVSDVSGTFAALKRVRVTWPACLTTPVTWEALAAELQRYEEVLCVTHQRKDARELAGLVPGSIHLSALMCPAHRLDIIGDVKRRLQTNRDRRQRGEAVEPVRLISTQLIEAGVDLDFPVVYRAAAGLDSVAQAAGRCNREGRLDGLGEVRIFVAPSQPPPGVPRFGLSVSREMLAGEPGLDALDPAKFDRFFQKLYFLQASLDEAGIQALREGWNFKSVAEAFAMIEEDGAEAVVVPFGEAPSRLQEVRDHGPSRDRLRALQPFVVKVYRQEFEAMEKAGAIEQVAETVKAVRVPGYARLYSPRFGLQTQGPFAADPTSLIA